MATITEDYVSFEIARLLKEKGFDTPVWTRYENDDNNVIFGDKYNWNNSPMGQISAPTHQMAIAWLRETHNIYIEFSCALDDNYKVVWTNSIWTTKEKMINYLADSENYFPYEESVEEAIKYSLENLI